MDRPCIHAIKCPGPLPGLDADSPITNYSSEQSDGVEFSSRRFPFSNPYDPRLPAWWSATGCLGTCTSFISQADADACAQRLADLCSWTPIPNTPNIPPGGGNGTEPTYPCLVNPASCLPETLGPFYNVSTQAGYRCPDGTFFYWFVPAGYFAASSQELADQVAAAYAQEQAALHHVCLSDLSGAFCKGTAGSRTITVYGNLGPYTFSVVSGTLPPGIVMSSTATSTTLSGVPTLGGTYYVTIRATDRLGSHADKIYSIGVIQITNSDPLPAASIGSPYSEQLTTVGTTGSCTFSIDSGTLPDGLSLSASGLISGTPTTSGTKDFGVRIVCTSGTCVQSFSLDVTGGCPAFARSIPIAGGAVASVQCATTTDVTYPKKIFVGRATDLVAIDRETELIIATIPNGLGNTPQYSAYDTANQIAVFTLLGAGNQKLQFVNAVTYASSESSRLDAGVPYSETIYHVANGEIASLHTNTGGHLYIERWNAATATFIAETINDLAACMAYGIASNRTYVGTFFPGIDVYNAAWAIVATWTPTIFPEKVAYAEGFDKLYVEEFDGLTRQIEVFDTTTGFIVNTIPLPAVTTVIDLKWVNASGYVALTGVTGGVATVFFYDPATDTLACSSGLPGTTAQRIGSDDTGRVYIPQNGTSTNLSVCI